MDRTLKDCIYGLAVGDALGVPLSLGLETHLTQQL